MTKTAWVFPGQGSQALGMGLDLNDSAIAQNLLAQASEILGWSVLTLCETEEEKLSQTLYTQPCLYVIECILVDLLKAQGQLPDFVAGHSLGEYVALYAANVFDFAAGLKLVQHRAALMDAAAGGKMVALMKFEQEQLAQELSKNSDVVLANDNSAEQVVISGTPEAVDELIAKVPAKRAVTLKVSGAFHSPLMSKPASEFEQALEAFEFNNASIPVVSNVEPTPTVDALLLKHRLVQQMTGGVRWREIMLQLPALEVTKVVEVGPGKVLTGLFKRTCPHLELKNVAGLVDI